MSYTHLSLAERHYVEIERKRGKYLSNISLALRRSQSTISREIKRNTGRRGYRHKQVAGKPKDDGVMSIHHETIYQYILEDKRGGGTLYTHLRHQHKTYRKRYGSANNRLGILNRTCIGERPEVVENRERVGDWEGDTIIGKNHKGAIVTRMSDEQNFASQLHYLVKKRTL